ncbi:hypothetical protein POJ06DRAFT_142731 [Lipomyces tetrasporus]|uniref:Uncharacterized protein n=1 Tax=Lipomyces tetrasporus TaxID=54092 RepID=A0AAD7QP82_9ASCO|nr:uncharacterized protein POJ06DRAFT_142731 [Lipomyces tetrasporus]KAJ8098819.1 hypothetical protein POJ06DRAFT_142731 [Lipomyces tetrasporus]
MELLHPYSSAIYPMVPPQKQKRKLSEDGGANKKKLRSGSVIQQISSMQQVQGSHLQHCQFPIQQGAVDDNFGNGVSESNINVPWREARIPDAMATTAFSREHRHEYSRSVGSCCQLPSSNSIDGYQIQTADSGIITPSPELQPEPGCFLDALNGDIELSGNTTDRPKASPELEPAQLQSHNGPTLKRRKIVYSMGYRADCEKCRARIRGHYSHIVYLDEN